MEEKEEDNKRIQYSWSPAPSDGTLTIWRQLCVNGQLLHFPPLQHPLDRYDTDGTNADDWWLTSVPTTLPAPPGNCSVTTHSHVMGGFGNSAGSVGLSNGMNSSPTSSSIYSSAYGVGLPCESPPQNGNSGVSQMACGVQDDVWRGSSIATLRRKALEHTVSMTGFR